MRKIPLENKTTTPIATTISTIVAPHRRNALRIGSEDAGWVETRAQSTSYGEQERYRSLRDAAPARIDRWCD
jgi:hypothetical protein